jgi:hypothetical protein
MSQSIKIERGDRIIGSINFDTYSTHLSARRTAAGFVITLPAALTLRLVGRNEPRPVVSNLRGTVSATTGTPGVTLEAGRLRGEGTYNGSWSEEPGGESKREIPILWQGTFEELAVYEKLREGKVPQLHVNLEGELSYLLDIHPLHQVRSAPQEFYGHVTVTYHKELWVERLRAIGVLDNVLVEVPLPSSPPAPWDEVWQNLVSARTHFEQGGSTGWSSCILAVRQALEKWRDIEGVNTGPTDPTKRNKAERLNNLRQALHQCTHVWIHKDEESSRDDALLMLSTLSALLAERKP